MEEGKSVSRTDLPLPHHTEPCMNRTIPGINQYTLGFSGIIVFILIHLSSYPEVSPKSKSRFESNESQLAEPSFHPHFHSCMAAVHWLSAMFLGLSYFPSSPSSPSRWWPSPSKFSKEQEREEQQIGREKCRRRKETLTQAHQSSTSHQVQYPSTSMVPQSLFS